MQELFITKESVECYLEALKLQEKSKGTLEKYRRELYRLMAFFQGKSVEKEDLLQWKAALEIQYHPAGINCKIVAANGFFAFMGRYNLRMKLLKIQKEIFCPEEKELTKEEYVRLIRAAEKRDWK